MRLILTTILLASCAVAGDTGAVAPACGPDAVQFNVKKEKHAQPSAQADAGKALVYVISDQRPGGTCIVCAVTARIGLDGAWIGANRGDS